MRLKHSPRTSKLHTLTQHRSKDQEQRHLIPSSTQAPLSHLTASRPYSTMPTEPHFPPFPYPSFTHSTSNLPPTHSNHPRKQEFSPNNALQIPLPPYPPHTTSRSPASHQRKQESINLPQQLIELIQQIYGHM